MKILEHIWRSIGLYLIPMAIVFWLFGTDPDVGASTKAMLQNLATGMLAITVGHLARKYLMPYLKMDRLYRAALHEGNVAAALMFAGTLIFTGILILMFAPRAHAGDLESYIPAGAIKYAPVLRAEQERLWPYHPNAAMLGALVEQESCIGLRGPRCWNPSARNSAPNEEGAGLGQITRTPRFDALAEVRLLDPSLAEWSWSNVYTRPDLQLRAIVVMNRDCDRRLKTLVFDGQARLEMCDAAYNGGYAGMQHDRRACGQKPGCNPQVWFSNVEDTCTKSKAAAAGYRRGPCVINREHVQMVAVVRRPKYEQLMVGLQ